MKLLDHGFHLAYIKSRTRFGTKDDCDRKSRLICYLAEKYNLSKKCVPIGMSCGGAHAVNFAGRYPELVSCMYIDAPVLNFNDFPAKYNRAEFHHIFDVEFNASYPGTKQYMLMNFPHHPLCHTEILIKNRIPILLVYGKEDATVLYPENGQLLVDAMEGTGLVKVIEVKGRGHHPHGKLDDNAEIVNWILEHC
jgi:pimeloyl-ACP methyl ester carboxylesterase